MKCSACQTEVESCDGCAGDFEVGAELVCIDGEHFCCGDCLANAHAKSAEVEK